MATLKTIAELKALGATLEDTNVERSILWYMLKDRNTLDFTGKSATFVKKFFATKELFNLVPMASFKKRIGDTDLFEKKAVFQYRSTGSDDMTALCNADGFKGISDKFAFDFTDFDTFCAGLDAYLANLSSQVKAEREANKAERADRLATFEAASPTNNKEKFDVLEKQEKALESAIKTLENADLDTTDLNTLLENIKAQLSGGEAAPLVRETTQDEPAIQQA